MTHTARLATPLTLARTGGALYLLIAVAGGFAIGYLPTILSVPGDAVATALTIADNMELARLGIFAEIMVLLAEIGLTAILYELLTPVSAFWARTAAWSRLLMVAIQGVNIALSGLALNLIGAATSPADVAETTDLLLRLRDTGVDLWGLFFAMHLAILGSLVFASGYLSKILGAAIALGSLGYLFDSLATLVLPGNDIVGLVAMVFLGVSMVGEIGFTFYLLIRGLDEKAYAAITA
ncbi:MAG: DUF4386 domain-containing protein [Alphaproteobacteria bacterium]|nr:DUF4386 domain-containing protein [Alphaproteobacteria bacterium]